MAIQTACDARREMESTGTSDKLRLLRDVWTQPKTVPSAGIHQASGAWAGRIVSI